MGWNGVQKPVLVFKKSLGFAEGYWTRQQTNTWLSIWLTQSCRWLTTAKSFCGWRRSRAWQGQLIGIVWLTKITTATGWSYLWTTTKSDLTTSLPQMIGRGTTPPSIKHSPFQVVSVRDQPSFNRFQHTFNMIVSIRNQPRSWNFNISISNMMKATHTHTQHLLDKPHHHRGFRQRCRTPSCNARCCGVRRWRRRPWGNSMGCPWAVLRSRGYWWRGAEMVVHLVTSDGRIWPWQVEIHNIHVHTLG